MATKRANRKASKRSLAAKKGWVTRRRRQAAEHRRRSKASRKGWRRRKAREKIEQAAKQAPKAKRGALREFIVTWSYKGAASRKNKGSKSRSVGFTVIARTTQDAELYVVKAAASGQDSNGADLTWMEQVPWNETETTNPEQDDAESRKAIRAAGEGYVELR